MHSRMIHRTTLGLATGALAVVTSATIAQGVAVNYDFIPGDRVIFAEDFTRDNIGDFPRRLELKQGNMEVAEWNGQRFLRATSDGTVVLPLPEVLPDRFTFEADYSGNAGWSMEVRFADPDKVDDPTFASFSPTNGGLSGSGVESSSDIAENAQRPITHVAIMADGKYAKVYVNGVRVSNVPNANLGRSNKIWIKLPAHEDAPAYLTNIRVAAGGKKLYEALASTGRVSTHGILFDVGSDRIRAESTPTLKEIGQMLKDHPDLKLMIEGHTDNIGSATANQVLSEKRAAAVKAFLVSTYGIDGGRLQTKGYGATRPVASNDSSEGRQTNRRVDLVKI